MRLRLWPGWLGKVAGALAIGGLAACSQAAQEANTQACTKESVADLPMAPGIAWPVVVAALDGQAVSMMLDTGSERLGVRSQAAVELRLPQDRRHSTRMRGLGGTSVAYDVALQSFEIGGTELPQSGAAVIEMPAMPAARPAVAGVIGAQTLSDYDVELDFVRRHVVFWEVSGCAQVMPAWQGTWSSARLARGAGNLVSLDVDLNGQAVRALLDTGARNTTIDFETANRLGIGSAALAAGKEVVTRGADGSDVVAHVIRMQEVSVGSVRSANFPVLVSPVHLPFAGMLLGVDLLQHRDVWISYAGRELFIR